MLNSKDIENINKALKLAITNAIFEETKKEYIKTYEIFNGYVKNMKNT